MNNSIESWRHDWFGYWKESGPAYVKCPSIYDFIDHKISDCYDLKKITQYIENAESIATTSRMAFPCVITGKIFFGSLSERTDGKWLWPDDLSYYVKCHAVCLPNRMLAFMEGHNYTPPRVDDALIGSLEEPPIVSI